MRLASLVALSLIASAAPALAQADAADAWPTKPVRFIVPFPAGSSTDAIARIIGQTLSTRVGQPFVIENRVGASGNLGSDAIARAAPDGYTIGVATTSTHAVAPSLSTNLPYDPLRDFATVSLIGSSPYVMVTYPGLGAKRVQDFVALAKAKPGVLTYGSAGPASLAHLASALFARTAGVQIVHVPYKSTAQSVTDLITGRLDMQLATIAPTLPLIRSGQLRALATTGDTRAGIMSELPTLAEAGLPGYEATLWMGIVMPAATPPSIVAKLNKALREALTAKATSEVLVAQGVDPEPGTPEAFRAHIASEIAKWRGVVMSAGIQAE